MVVCWFCVSSIFSSFSPLCWADAIGVPLYLFIDLYRHKIHFYADKEGAVSDKHDWAYQKLGAMFTQYE